MSGPESNKATSPWRWVLLVVALVAAGYSAYFASGLTTQVNQRPHRPVVPTQPVDELPLCPVPDSMILPERVDVRFRVETSDSVRIAHRLTARVDANGLRLPGARGPGVGTVRLSDGGYASFELTEDACSELTRLPPPDDSTLENTP